MKKLFFLILSLILFNTAHAEIVIGDINNINTVKCTGTMVSGSINQYENATFEYIFKDGKIFSPNLNNLFGNITKEPKKVMRLKITENYITFKDRLYKMEASYYAWAKIDRKTGEFLLNAKNEYGFFFKRANIKGVCVVEN